MTLTEVLDIVEQRGLMDRVTRLRLSEAGLEIEMRPRAPETEPALQTTTLPPREAMQRERMEWERDMYAASEGLE